MEKITHQNTRSEASTASIHCAPNVDNETKFPATHGHASNPIGLFAWVGALAFSAGCGIALILLTVLAATLLVLSAQLCISGELLKAAAQPYHRELDPLGSLAFALVVAGPPVGVFGSIIWVVSTSRKNCLAEHRAETSALRQGGCIASYSNRHNLLRLRLALAPYCKFMATLAMVTYIAIIGLVSFSALMAPPPNPGFS